MVIIVGNERIAIGPALQQGGAGSFHPHPTNPDVGIKIYSKQEDADAARIEHLCANPPLNLLENGVPTHAWPIAAAYDESTGELVGFTLPRIRDALPLQGVVNPSSRISSIGRRWLWKVAVSVVKRVHTLHLLSPAHIVGDVNLENILVHRKGSVTLIDLDSTHFSLPSGQTFLCDRCRPELQPPELVSASGTILDRYQHQDAFSVYIVVHRLLREGLSPFDAHYVGSGTPLRTHELIERGIWPESLLHPEYRPVPGTVPFASLPDDIQDLFRRMFHDGIFDFTKRPNVTELLNALQVNQPAGSGSSAISARDWRRALQTTSGGVMPGDVMRMIIDHPIKAFLAASLIVSLARYAVRHYPPNSLQEASVSELLPPAAPGPTENMERLLRSIPSCSGPAPATRANPQPSPPSAPRVVQPLGTPSLWREAEGRLDAPPS